VEKSANKGPEAGDQSQISLGEKGRIASAGVGGPLKGKLGGGQMSKGRKMPVKQVQQKTTVGEQGA